MRVIIELARSDRRLDVLTYYRALSRSRSDLRVFLDLMVSAWLRPRVGDRRRRAGGAPSSSSSAGRRLAGCCRTVRASDPTGLLIIVVVSISLFGADRFLILFTSDPAQRAKLFPLYEDNAHKKDGNVI